MHGEARQGEAVMEREVKVLSSVSHPHVVQLLGMCTEPGCQALVYELMEGGSLEKALGLCEEVEAAASVAVELAWRERVRIATEVVAALMRLHDNKPPIYHMDMKPGNILLDRSVDNTKSCLQSFASSCTHNLRQRNTTPHNTTQH
jgi:serine/threonine protein kinase